MATPRRIATLGRWLGPWTREESVPDVIRQCVAVPGRDGRPPIPLWLYRPRGRVEGTYLLLQGLHFAGPRDPRLDRFARILAAAGFQVFAPELPDYIAMRITGGVTEDARHIARLVAAHPDRLRSHKLGVFTISFGSLPGLAVASDPALRGELGELVVFGGYRDPDATIRFCATGKVNGEVVCSHDPLNTPALFLQVWDDLPEMFGDAAPEPVVAHWLRFIRRTWGRPHLKARFAEIAEGMVDQLEHADARDAFLVGTGARPGGVELIETAMVRSDLRHLDPAPFFPGIHVPVTLLHGRDDDVIPHTEASALEHALAPHASVASWVTGMYGHTATETDVLTGLKAASGELKTLLGMLGAIARGGAHRR